jgi:hypothetical protein
VQAGRGRIPTHEDAASVVVRLDVTLSDLLVAAKLLTQHAYPKEYDVGDIEQDRLRHWSPLSFRSLMRFETIDGHPGLSPTYRHIEVLEAVDGTSDDGRFRNRKAWASTRQNPSQLGKDSGGT